MAKVYPNEVAFAKDLCMALGVDPSKTMRLSLDINPDGLARATVYQYVTADEADELVSVVRRYRLRLEEVE
jgi:hypothetical protein